LIIKIPDDGTWAKSPIKTKRSLFKEANRDTTIIYVKVEDNNTGIQFNIVCYHMPCCFWYPAVMVLHLNTLREFISKCEGNYVLMGDFNTIYNSPLYYYLVNGILNDDIQKPYSTFKSSSDIILYTLCNGLPTTHCKNIDGSTFKERIDFIFFNKDLLNLYNITEYVKDINNTIIPNKENGSDHIPIELILIPY